MNDLDLRLLELAQQVDVCRIERASGVGFLANEQQEKNIDSTTNEGTTSEE